MPRKERSLMEQAYAELKRRIITLELKPGQRLDDYELSQELKFSRTPVREAIFLLGAEGWVDIRSKAGFIVRPLDLVDIAHFFTDIDGLFVINNESGWYEGWMIHDLIVAPEKDTPRKDGHAQFGKILKISKLARRCF